MMLMLKKLKNLKKLKLFSYSFSLRPLSSFEISELKLVEYGNNAETSLKLITQNLTEQNIYENFKNSKNDLFIRLIASPINPADLNIIQGKYAYLPPQLPANIGNEGLFEVVKSNNKEFKPGDWVLPTELGFGSWRSHTLALSSNFIKISNKLDKQACSTLLVNPCTAFRLLNDFVNLKENDTVIQNGANSAVGQSIIQLGKIMNINVVNIVRKRDSQQKQDELNDYLISLGAKYIFTEDELRKQVLTKDLWTRISKPKLAFNCVGGKATTDMVRLLDKDSIMVTYGGMSRQPLTLNTADFIFKNLKCMGFWLTAWRSKNKDEFKKSILYLADLIEKNQFKGPKCQEFKLNEFKDAIQMAQTPYHNQKVLFVN
jgi:trans-2-enoyl-CoA reductase